MDEMSDLGPMNEQDISSLAADEVEFYTDMAMNECQRWIEDWIHHFLRVCIRKLAFKGNQVFWPEDLVADIDDIGREGRFPPETLSKIRRVVVTIYELALKLEGSEKGEWGGGPRLDSSALEPLVKHHYRISSETDTDTHPSVASQLHTDVKKTLNTILDLICDIAPDSPVVVSSSGTSGYCGEEAFQFPPEICMDASVSEKVHKYLAELPEDQVSEGASDQGSRTSEYIPRREERIPTRHFTVASNPVPHDPLKFVAVNGATNLAESAKQKIRLAEESRKMKEATEWKFKEEEESEWVSNLDQWKEKRKKSLSSSALKTLTTQKETEHEPGWKKEMSKDLDTNGGTQRSFGGKDRYHEEDTHLPSLRPAYRERELERKKEEERERVDVRVEEVAPRSAPPSHSMDASAETLAVERHVTNGGDRLSAKLSGASMEDSGHFGTETEDSDQISPNYQISTNSDAWKSFPSMSGRAGRREKDEVVESAPPMSVNAETSIKASAYDRLVPFTDPGLDKLQRNPHTAGLAYLSRYHEEVDAVDSGVEPRPDSVSPTTNTHTHSPTPIIPMNGEAGRGWTANGSERGRKNIPDSVLASHPSILRDEYKDKPQIKWRYQQKDSHKTYQDSTVSLEISPNCDKGFGLTIKGGRDSREPVKVHGVILGGAADRGRVMVGDEVLFINGEDVSNKFLAKVNMMIRESQRLGEMELILRRAHTSGPQLLEKSPVRRSPSPRAKATFDEKRSVFSQERARDDGFLRFKKNRRHSEYPMARSSSIATTGHTWTSQRSAEEPVNRITSPVFQRRKEPGRIENFVPEVEREERSGSPGLFDYRVSSLQRTRSPGRILDFVPENERRQTERAVVESTKGSTHPPQQDVHWRKEKEYIMSRQGTESGEKMYYLRPSSRSSSSSSRSRSEHFKSPSPVRNYTIDGPVGTGRLTVNTHSRENSGADTTGSLSSHLSPASSHMTTSSGSAGDKFEADSEFKESGKPFGESDEVKIPVRAENDRAHVDAEQDAEKFVEAKLQRIEQTKKIRTHQKRARASFLGLPTRQSSQESETEIDKFDCNNYLRWDVEKEFHNKALELLNSTTERNSDIQIQEERPLIADSVKQANPVNFWEGRNVVRPILVKPVPMPRRSVLVVPVRHTPPRKGSVAHSKGQEEAEETSSELHPTPDTHFTPIQGEERMVEEQPRPFSHVKKDIIFSSEPVPGERRPAAAYYPPLSQQLKAKEQPAPMSDHESFSMKPLIPTTAPPANLGRPEDWGQGRGNSLLPDDSLGSARSGDGARDMETELKYMSLGVRAEEESLAMGGRKTKGNEPSRPHPMPRMSVNTQDHWLVKEAEDRRLSQQMRDQRSPRHSAHHDHGVGGRREKEAPPVPPSHPPPPPPQYTEPSEPDQVVSVSGRQKCSHCAEELGRGAAMIIESLNLFYHLGCFRCYVCSVALGNGAQGADVRIRAGKLHCQSCYSNDEVGLKFSEV